MLQSGPLRDLAVRTLGRSVVAALVAFAPINRPQAAKPTIRRLTRVAISLSPFLLTGCSLKAGFEAPPAENTAYAEPVACEAGLPKQIASRVASCFRIDVPARSPAHDCRIDFPVVVYRDHTAPPDKKTHKRVIVEIPGGPGQSGISFAAESAERLGTIANPQADMVYFDYRGLPSTRATCRSTGAPESGTLPQSTFSAPQVATDIEMLRRALYPEQQIDLISFSAGSLPAYYYRYNFPEALRSLTLVEGTPLDWPSLAVDRRARHIEGVLHQAITECAASAACSSAYPDFGQQLNAILSGDLRSGSGRGPSAHVFSWVYLIANTGGIVDGQLKGGMLGGVLPVFIDRLHRALRDPGKLEALTSTVNQLNEPRVGGIDEAVRQAQICQEPQLWRAPALIGELRWPVIAEFLKIDHAETLCPAANASSAGPKSWAPALAPVPIFHLRAGLDVSAGGTWPDKLAAEREEFSVTVPYFPHGGWSLDHGCPQRLLQAFWTDPESFVFERGGERAACIDQMKADGLEPYF